LTDQKVPLTGVEFSPDGRYVATAGSDGAINVYIVSVEELVEVARSRLSRDFTNEECRRYLHLPMCLEE
jgi:WD40 repeat protein